MGRLWDASGPNDAPYFMKKHSVTTWSDKPIEPTPELPETQTVGSLLREKKGRVTASAEPVELDLYDRDPVMEHPEQPANRSTLVGVKKTVAERFFSTLDAIRWTRKPPR